MLNLFAMGRDAGCNREWNKALGEAGEQPGRRSCDPDQRREEEGNAMPLHRLLRLGVFAAVLTFLRFAASALINVGALNTLGGAAAPAFFPC